MQQRGDYQTIANRIRTDMDGRGPRLRLSVVGYLIDNEVTPDKLGGVNEWLDLVEKTVNYVTADMEEYATIIENLVEPDETNHPEEEVKDAYDINKRGSQYLWST
ncbi:hypothetical protein LCGC14_3155410 [marine sediment metagenome]|uniref:Uncharacterized protein n=1 Tax=marine sediment metagenome TaxID=412755 RepID=A0A0F8VW30_9ZZZZ